MINGTVGAGFTYRLDRLKPRVSKCRGAPANTVLSKQPCSNCPYIVALHFRILQNFKHFIEVD